MYGRAAEYVSIMTLGTVPGFTTVTVVVTVTGITLMPVPTDEKLRMF
jgi:hypothetical protein